MEELDKEFDVPYYIFEEIIEYIEFTAKGYYKIYFHLFKKR